MIRMHHSGWIDPGWNLSSVQNHSKSLYHSMKYWLVENWIPLYWINDYNPQYLEDSV